MLHLLPGIVSFWFSQQNYVSILFEPRVVTRDRWARLFILFILLYDFMTVMLPSRLTGREISSRKLTFFPSPVIRNGELNQQLLAHLGLALTDPLLQSYL